MRATDWCCGDGGMTAGMLKAGFQVQGVDVVRRPAYPAPVVIHDVRTAPPDLVPWSEWDHFSPPCNRFSQARAWAWKDDPPTEADLDILEACLRLRDQRKPTYWSVENVRGAVKWFRPLLGEPRLKHGPFFFWGNFPGFLLSRSGIKKGLLGGSRSPGHGNQRHTHRDPWLRARVPFELAGPMAQAIAQELQVPA